MAARRRLKVEQAPYNIDSWNADAASGRLQEAFACGAAAVVAAVRGGVEGQITKLYATS